MARIEFVPDLRREGACGTWGAILLGDGGLCAAMRLPVAASDRATIDRVLTAIREVMRASVPGVAPIADVAVGGNQVWVFVGIAPGPSVADLLYDLTLAPADLALIALDAGRALVRLHDSGLWHGAFGAETIVATRTGAIHLTEAGLGPALDGLDVHISRPRAADVDGTGESADTVSAGVSAPSNDVKEVIATSNGAARAEVVKAGGATFVAEPSDPARWDMATGNPSGTHEGPLTDGAQVDASAWADSVRLFANHLRAARAETEAAALATCARRADDAGIAAALDDLDVVARTFADFPDRSGLVAAMSGYAIEDEPEPDTILRAIDALFDTTAPPSPPRPSRSSLPSLPGRFRSPLGRGGSRKSVADAKASATAGADPYGLPLIPAQAGADRFVGAIAEASDTGSNNKGTSDTEAGASVASDTEAGASVASDTEAGASGASDTRASDTEASHKEAGASVALATTTAPPRGPRRTSVIPTRLPRSPQGASTEAPHGLWAPSAAPKPAPPRPGVSVDAPAKPDNTVRVGRGVPASNGRRATPARLGRPAWWPRIAINIGVAVIIVLAVGGYVWWRLDRPLHVTSVSVTVQRHVAAACQLDADVVGTVITTGGTGTFTYEWLRSDGTTTAVHVGKVTDPAKPTEVHLPWTFNGAGEETAQVTLVVLTPQRREASTSFEYICTS